MSEKRVTVLILDDEDVVRESLAYYFEDRGWRVLSAASGEEALDVLAREPVDCAVVDVRLPGMDGSEFVRRATVTHSGTVFVFCTGSPDYHMPESLSALPCVGETVFHKPIRDIAALAQALLQLVEQLKCEGCADE